MKITTDIYMHGDKERNWDHAEKLGMSKDAIRNFRYAALEVKLTLEVETETGAAEIIAVDDRKLEPKNEF